MIWSMTDMLQPHLSDRESDRRAREWLDNVDHQAAVGARHHIVPRFLLARFASAEGQLRVRNRTDGRASLRSISDLAVRDFYTAVTECAVLDARLESLLSAVEGGAAEILRQHLDCRTFARPRAFTPEERATLDAFVAMQAVRGMRTRRSIEALTDYTVKLFNQDKIPDEDTRNTEFVPHPNEHLKMFGNLAAHAEVLLRSRSTTMVRLDKPLLMIGDEPVLTANDQDETEWRRGTRPDMASGELVLLESGGGFAHAEVIMLPVTPSIVLLYGPPDVHRITAELLLTGVEAECFADEHNRLMVESAIDWVAASPKNPSVVSMKMPPPRPLLAVYDYGSLAAAQANTTPARRPIRRVRPDDVLDVKPHE